MNKKPNIVLIVSDDHGREALGCYGNPVIQTPNMDALAAEGVRFVNSFCTAATCAASRATILTGLQNHTTGTYGHTHGFHHFSCFDNIRTLPAMIKASGYRTGRAGKRHYAPESIYPFDWSAGPEDWHRDDVKMADNCREFIAGSEPFFLHWCSFNPHRWSPITTHPLKPDSFGNPDASFPGDQEQTYPEDKVIIPSFLNDTPEMRAELAQYYQSISRMDRGIGRLISILKDTGKWNNTVIIYISDNGAAWPQAKTTLYEPGMNLPCIVRSPLHRNRGATCDGLITWADITPTILDFAGATPDPDSMFGRSFRGIIDEETPENWREEIFAAHTFHGIRNYYPMRAVRTKRYKFIYNIAWKLDYPFASDLYWSSSWQGALRDGATHIGLRTIDAYHHRPRFELYDLSADPHELNNLAAAPEYADLVEQFCGKLKAFQQQTQDPWITKWTYE